jgi:hypothetical protein
MSHSIVRTKISFFATAAVATGFFAATADAAPKPKKRPAPAKVTPAPASSDPVFKHGADLVAGNVEGVVVDNDSGWRVIVGQGLYDYAPGPGMIVDRIPGRDPRSDEHQLHNFSLDGAAIPISLLHLSDVAMKNRSKVPVVFTLQSFRNGVVTFDMQYENLSYDCTYTPASNPKAPLEPSITAQCKHR